MASLSIHNKKFYIAIAAPSGAGKTTICSMLLEKYANLSLSISHTSRPPRGEEEDGEDYFFITKEEFKEMRENGYFLEWATVHEHDYGTSLLRLEAERKKEKIVLFDIDVQGVQSLQQIFAKELISIFILPPSMEVLRQRLVARSMDTAEVIEKRLLAAQEEIFHKDEFDFVVTNHNLDKTFLEICNFLIAATSTVEKL